MKRAFSTFFLVVLLAAYLYSQQADTTRVLFIGNSFTAANNLPAVFSYMAVNGGHIVEVDSRAPGGYTLQQHSSDPASIQKIFSNDWDYVVLQEQSQRPSYEQWRDTMVYPYAAVLDSLIHASNPCAQTVFFLTWAHKNGDLSILQNGGYDTYWLMQSRLRDGYMYMADTFNAMLAPVGWAWREVRLQNSSINMYAADDYHPNITGTYLAAATFYSAIFQDSAAQLSYYGSVNTTTADYLRSMADTIVFDSLGLWNIGIFNQQPIAGFQYQANFLSVSFSNISQNALNYKWFFGDGDSSSLANPVHNYANPGMYPVALYALNNCGLDTAQKNLNLVSTRVRMKEDDSPQVYPVPAKNKIIVEFEAEEMGFVLIALYDMNNRLIYQDYLPKNQHVFREEIFIDGLENGMYYLKVTTGNQNFTRKVICQ